MLRTIPRRALLVWAALLVALSAGRASATCHSTCTEELRACRQGCAALTAVARRPCVQDCRDRSTCAAAGAGIRTVAYVVTECRRDAQGLNSIAQKLLVRRGNCDPATVLELPAVAPVPDPLGDALGGTCHNFGAFRFGSAWPLIGGFQRLGVVPNGSGVVVEITNDRTVNPALAPEPAEEGLFFVQADGARRPLGPASAVPIFSVDVHPDTDPPFTVVQEDGASFNFSPDGRRFALTDVGPAPDGEMARQIFVMELGPTGRRRQHGVGPRWRAGAADLHHRDRDA
ncbi:MAG: hypothetical protein ACREQL_00290 [Candidatus Binatia bacterium]